MKPRAKFSTACLGVYAAILLASAVVCPSADAQCDPSLFADNATDPNFFWSDVDCSADKGFDDMAGAAAPKLIIAGQKAVLNAYAKGVGDAYAGIMGEILGSPSKDVFGPSNADLMRAVQAGTNRVISRVNQGFSDTDMAHVESVQQAYVLYQGDPQFHRRVAKASAEWANNGEWFKSLNLLALDRHGPLALHASLSLSQVFARRMMDLELAYEVMHSTPPSNPPYNPRYDAYIASATDEDLDFWATNAGEQALRDARVIFNGGNLSTRAGSAGVAVPGFFNHVSKLANGGFRAYSDSRFSQLMYTSSETAKCGSSFSYVTDVKGEYHFPLDPNDPGANESAPKYKFSISWDACAFLAQKPRPTQTTERLKITNSKGEVIFNTTFLAPIGDAGLPDNRANQIAERVLKQAAYDKFLTMAYGSVRPIMDMWWKLVGNSGYTAYTADREINALVMRASAVRTVINQIKSSAPDWANTSSPAKDERELVNYALAYGAGGLDELHTAAQADRVAWSSKTTRAYEYRQFLSVGADPKDAEPYFRGQMAAKIMAVMN